MGNDGRNLVFSLTWGMVYCKAAGVDLKKAPRSSLGVLPMHSVKKLKKIYYLGFLG